MPIFNAFIFRSSKYYYKWLHDHPNEKMPPFLEDIYEAQSRGHSVCDIRDLMKIHKISQTFLPVMRPNIKQEESMQTRAMGVLL